MIRSIHGAWGSNLLFALFLVLTPAAVMPTALPAGEEGDEGKEAKKESGEGDEGSPGEKSDEGSTTGLEKLSPEEKYIRSKLKDYLHPTSVEFEKDGRVKLEFDFGKKSEEHESIFHCKFGKGNRDTFRWSFQDEEWVIGGLPGIRLSDKGFALLKAWFVDDVEAEMEFRQYINHSNRHVAGLIYWTEKGKALGSNYGSQCMQLTNGAIQKAAGKTTPVRFNETAKIKMSIHNEVLEAHREGKKKAEMKFSRRGYESGRIGIIWGGSLSAIVPSLSITGKLDTKKMAKEMREYFGDE